MGIKKGENINHFLIRRRIEAAWGRPAAPVQKSPKLPLTPAWKGVSRGFGGRESSEETGSMGLSLRRRQLFSSRNE